MSLSCCFDRNSNIDANEDIMEHPYTRIPSPIAISSPIKSPPPIIAPLRDNTPAYSNSRLTELDLFPIFEKLFSNNNQYDKSVHQIHTRNVLKLINQNLSTTPPDKGFVLNYPIGLSPPASICHIIFDKETHGKSVGITFKNSSKSFSHGSYLYVYEATLVTVPIDGIRPLHFTFKASVIKTQNIINSNNIKASPATIRSTGTRILQGISFHTELQKFFATSEKVRIASTPRFLSPPESAYKGYLTVLQEKYYCDMSHLLYDLNENRKFRAEICDILDLLIAVAETLEEMHSKRLCVHLDITPGNTLIEMNGSQMTPRISDFDFARVISGKTFNSSSYNYYVHDTCMKNGWATPLCDTWSLLLSLLDIVCPEIQTVMPINPARFFYDPATISQYKQRIYWYYLNARTLTYFSTHQTSFLVKLTLLLSDVYTADHEESIQYIDSFIMRNPHLTNDEKEFLKLLPTHINVIKTIYEFLCDAYSKNKAAYELLLNNPEIQEAIDLKLEPPYTDEELEKLERKKAAIRQLEREFYSIPDVIKWLRDLQNYYKVYPTFPLRS